jgi:geranylgeranyl pyrophosphate synthase
MSPSFIEENLSKHLAALLPPHGFSEVYRYLVLPPGKLFRAQLIHALAQDLGQTNPKNTALLASFVEIHHAYTLAHDDLPCMDDDDFRRGRPSAHKAYSEWQALLAADGLAVGGFSLLTKLDHSQAVTIIRWAATLLGPKGLILGQAKDLLCENSSLEKILQIHRLKTGRLFQFALLAGAFLSSQGWFPHAYRLGDSLGIFFQLLDDLMDLNLETQGHEKNINPFILFPKDSATAIQYYFQRTQQGLKRLPQTRAVFDVFYQGALKRWSEQQKFLEPASSLLDILNHLQISH